MRLLSAVLTGLLATLAHAVGDPAQDLADAVTKASGADAFSKLHRLRFTFVAEDGNANVLLRAKHDWDLTKKTDEVAWKDKKVTLNLASPPTDGDGKEAFARWTNDSYWLLAPLKLKDGGAMSEAGGTAELDGKTYQVLKMHFAGVGMTPGDQYALYINPESHLLEAWDYMPNPETKVHATWEKYQDVNGMHLATFHHFGDKVIRFEDLAAE